MARELVTEKGIGERADSVWAKLQKQQEEVFAVKSSPIDEPTLEPSREAELFASPKTPLESTHRKTSRGGVSLEGQLTLF